MSNTKNHSEVLESPAFKDMVRKRWSFSIVMTLIMLSIYFGYLLVIAFNKPALATMIGHNITIAIPIGLGIIISAWAMTGVYVYWANSTHDDAVNKLKEEIKK